MTTDPFAYRFQAVAANLAAAFLALLLGVASAHAEVNEVRIAQQFGINYLPLTIMKKYRLVEKKAAEAGLGEVSVTWAQFGAGAGMNDALLSGSLDFASGGVGPLLTIWDKAKGILDVKGVAALGSMPLYLNTTNPKVKSVKDFTAQDKIALPAVKVSIQAVLLQMAAAQAFGQDNYARLDPLTVSMKHPEALAALLSRGTEITAHFGNAPFQEQELADPKVHRVLSSYDILGRSTLNSLYTTSKFHDANPKLYRAVLAALKDAVKLINDDKSAAAQVYIDEEQSKLSLPFVVKILSDPDFIVTTTPEAIAKYATFMHKINAIRNLPKDWKDVYFPEIHDAPGS